MEEGQVNGLTDVDAAGRERMVDVCGNEATAQSAGASGRVLLSAGAVPALRAGRCILDLRAAALQKLRSPFN
jgi:molybdenum cofactor biosynthesis enzyme